jgi:hypothetical protein
MIYVLSKVTLLNVNSTYPPPCLILYQHHVNNISTLPNTLPQYPTSRGALAHKICIRHVFIFYCKNVNITSFSMPTSHIGTDIIQLHSLLIFEFGGEWSTSRSGRCVSREAFRYPLSGMRDRHHRRCGRYGEEKNIATRGDSNPGSLSS